MQERWHQGRGGSAPTIMIAVWHDCPTIKDCIEVFKSLFQYLRVYFHLKHTLCTPNHQAGQGRARLRLPASIFCTADRPDPCEH
eukprot:366384-Chlamydomonas_euryale.AAC.14